MTSSFDEIYRRNLWGGKDTRSGPGSSRAATEHLVKWLTDVLVQPELDDVDTVLDVPCGEGRWFPELRAWHYVGVDVVLDAVVTARIVHPDRAYFAADARVDRLPDCDLAFSRDFMQHLPLDDGVAFLANVRRSGPRFLIASTYVDGVNEEVRSPYHAYRVNLEAPPFSLGEPMDLFTDGYSQDGTLVDEWKKMGMWEL